MDLKELIKRQKQAQEDKEKRLKMAGYEYKGTVVTTTAPVSPVSSGGSFGGGLTWPSGGASSGPRVLPTMIWSSGPFPYYLPNNVSDTQMFGTIFDCAFMISQTDIGGRPHFEMTVKVGKDFRKITVMYDYNGLNSLGDGAAQYIIRSLVNLWFYNHPMDKESDFFK